MPNKPPDPLTQYILGRIVEIDEREGREVTEKFFGVDRTTINIWKRTKKLPWSAAVAVYTQDMINTPEEAPAGDPAPEQAQPVIPEVPAAQGEVVLAEPPPSPNRPTGASVPASSVRPSGQPRIVQPTMGSAERHPGIERIEPQPNGAPIDPSQIVALVTQSVLAALGQVPNTNSGPGGNVAPSNPSQLPQGNIKLAPGVGRGWNRPRTPPVQVAQQK